jgi:hypothetical protein
VSSGNPDGLSPKHLPTSDRRKRNPPRIDPIKSAAKMVAKHPNLVARVKPDGEIEFASKVATPSMDGNEVELDAGANDDVWSAIEAIRDDGGSHGRH